MHPPIQHPDEDLSNRIRAQTSRIEPRSLRTYTPSQAVLAHSAGVYHWTPEGRKLFDFSSGVLVANLGHNPVRWTERFTNYLGWPKALEENASEDFPSGYFPAAPLTAYNGITPIETQAGQRLVEFVRQTPHGKRLEQVMWAASGSEAIQKALWTAIASDRTRPVILATRFGFHGKKGLANAVTGSETDPERDPRVRFIRFPMAECADLANRKDAFDEVPFRQELDALWNQFGAKIGTLITEPYLGGGGSYHPPKAYHQMLRRFCDEKGIVLIFDEVQSNFGRTGNLFAFETYGIEPDLVVLGKGLGNGVPVAAVVGRGDLFEALDYGEGSDTWSANPLCCAAVLATLDEFDASDVMGQCRKSSRVIEEGLVRLKELPFVAHVRGEEGGMVWGIETREWHGAPAAEWANRIVLACYRGNPATRSGIHLLGPLAKKVVRVSPPLVITEAEAAAAMNLMWHCLEGLLGEGAER
jgi:4-aminobutyrate aminotransferase-like enzyme